MSTGKIAKAASFQKTSSQDQYLTSIRESCLFDLARARSALFRLQCARVPCRLVHSLDPSRKTSDLIRKKILQLQNALRACAEIARWELWIVFKFNFARNANDSINEVSKYWSAIAMSIELIHLEQQLNRSVIDKINVAFLNYRADSAQNPTFSASLNDLKSKLGR